jgi:pimeloyl-ACP methyl ester carboxylesterase
MRNPDVNTGFANAADGTRLYWRAVGEGPALVLSNGVGVSTFFWKYIVKHFRDRYRLILWDYRGHGLSDPIEDPLHAELSVGLVADDLLAVLDHAGVHEPAVFLGHSMGVQVSLEFTKRHPERVRGLVCLFGTFARPMDTFMDNPMSRRIFDRIVAGTRRSGHGGGRLLRPIYASPLALPFAGLTGLVDKYYAPAQDIGMYLEHLVQMDPRVFLMMVEALADHDLTDFLPEIRVPTMVFAGERDLFTPLHRSEYMAAHIPGAELLTLADGSHAAIVEHPTTINERIDRFFAERLPEIVTPDARAAKG